jgi:hypothetical protein
LNFFFGLTGFGLGVGFPPIDTFITQNLEYLQAVERQCLANPEKIYSLVEKDELKVKQLEESTQKNFKDISTDPHNVIDTIIPPSRKKRIQMKGNIK